MPFRTIVGHRPLLALLSGAAGRDSLPQSLIFAGPEGVGKRTTAVALAQLINCERPARDMRGQTGGEAPRDMRGQTGGEAPVWPGNDACGDCGSCRRIARGVHADVLVVAPGDTGHIKVDRVRDIVERAGYRPFEGRRRVFIVDEAEALLPEAQNALLKTLEEPSPASVFVLVTARPDVLLPTVRSRCQRLRFGRLSPADVALVLARDHGYSPADAQAAASASDGSIGRAIEEGTDAFVEARDAAARMLQTAASGADPRRRLDAAKALAGGRGASDRDELARRLRALSSLVRDLGLLISEGDPAALVNGDLAPVLQSARRSFDADRTLGAFASVECALSALDRNASPKIVADWVALQL